MHFDMLYSMRRVAIEAECMVPYTRFATLLWKRVLHVLPYTRAALSWPEAEAILRNQTIRLMLGKIAPHPTARGFAEEWLYIFHEGQEEEL